MRIFSKKIYNGILNLLFPPSCVLCKKDLISQDILICNECLVFLPKNDIMQPGNIVISHDKSYFDYFEIMIIIYPYRITKGSIMSSSNPKQQQINVELGEKEAEGIYSNLALISHSWKRSYPSWPTEETA